MQIITTKLDSSIIYLVSICVVVIVDFDGDQGIDQDECAMMVV